MTLAQRLDDFKRRNERWLPLLFFAAGFSFDAFMLRRIDEPLAIAQQGAYLAISATLICLSMIEFAPGPGLGARLWHYHEELMHFLLGTLLNAYTIFYFKAASAGASIVFVLLLCGLLYVNESKELRGRAAEIRLALFSLCLISYLVCVVPIALGHIGALPFLGALAAAAVAALPVFLFLRRHGLHHKLTVAFAGTACIFAGLYFAELIPPVPLSIKYMGVFHGLSKKNGEYELVMTRSRWKFWQHGDQDFAARPGDKLHFFVRVFSPARFEEKLSVRWLHHEAAGWRAWDAIPLPVTGGREEGFRGYTVKSNYEPGDWRVKVETHDGRELGRLDFTVVRDAETAERETRIELQ